MKYKILKEYARYIGEKILICDLSLNDYISTENMLPDKNGITLSEKLPHLTKVNAFKKDDILISNIRPYFKKIWKATFAGCCSNDVLVIRALKDINIDFYIMFYQIIHFLNMLQNLPKAQRCQEAIKIK